MPETRPRGGATAGAQSCHLMVLNGGDVMDGNLRRGANAGQQVGG